ncbi:2,3-dihydro-2,3-dihydroxybenzoate dehydrogenase [Actinoplanes sp. N902-109]|uniref:2,3-dihydro-2,3-dihydroxybenzoate dehydrogenase n=1 Tax=Actinoplanes sp. (strain N902-109) TaxID=649831 RepID=UPI0003295413|nr:2,3-dihydro-2,3-dihydroxybenzoate dehydrogenase [Actinoplanes sp. N902-109]AGL18884.1 2,3-dihydro-2,3-dihydroxybenzoate dehydrogenase [Actinoplanes sp. N902-109]
MSALVTGAARGIGAAVVRALTAAGHRVVATDLQPPRPAVPGVPGLALDVRDTAAVIAAVARAEDLAGPIDVLVNVAGVLRTGPVTGTTDADWHAVLDVNATGVFRVSREVGRRMADRGHGAIVTVASNAARVPRAQMAAYAASKAAAAHFTRCLGLELAPAGVRCNVVSPGSTDTPMQRALWTTPGGAAAAVAGDPAQYKIGIPLGRIAEPGDIAAAVAFLASEQARHITLQNLVVDGGAAL